jgi:hypothetical protein
MKTYASHDALFEATRDLAAQMQSANHASAAAELLSGLGAVNGLTDGWALFLESVERAGSQAEALPPAQAAELSAIRAGVRKAVFR